MRLRLALSIVVAGWEFAQSHTQSPVLALGDTRSFEFTANGSHEHYLVLTAGQYAHVKIKQHTVNVAVAVLNPTGNPLFALDTDSFGEAEDVELIAATSGNYRLRVTASEANAPTGRYEIILDEVGPESDRNRTRIAAARQIARATAAKRLATREAMLKAIGSFESARLHWHAADAPDDEARTLCAIAFIYIELGDRERRSPTPRRHYRSRESRATTRSSAVYSIASAKYITTSAKRRQQSTITCKRCRFCEARAIVPARLKPSTTSLWRMSE